MTNTDTAGEPAFAAAPEGQATPFGRAGTVPATGSFGGGGEGSGSGTGAGPEGEGPRLLPFRFSGQAGAFFRIWIVNVLLSVVTLGIYSAWAKVRTKRYFHGSTLLDGHALEYHATGKQIFIGRLVVLAGFAVYTLITTVFPLIAPLFALAFLFITPYLIRASLRFNARHTSWRNVRFDFVGTTWGAAKAFMLWPILGMFTLGIMMPHATRAMWRYIIGNHRYGQAPMEVRDMPLRPLYMAMIATAVAMVLVAAVAVGTIFLRSDPAAITGAGVVLQALGTFLVVGVMSFAVGIYQAVAYRTALHHAVIGDGNTVAANFSGLRLAWVVASNYFITVATLGLARPWCAIRLARYVIGNLALTVRGDLSRFIDDVQPGKSAIGEEFADFEGLDLGLA